MPYHRMSDEPFSNSAGSPQRRAHQDQRIMPDPALLEAMRRSSLDYVPLHHHAALDKRGRSIGKAPSKNSFEQIVDHMRDGGNAGVRLRDGQLGIDYDPRHDRERSA